MALKEDYLDDILDTSVNEKRKYRMINNADGTISLEDVTEYSQNGDNFGAFDINITNKTVNELIAMGLNVRCNSDGYLEVLVDGVWKQSNLKAISNREVLFSANNNAANFTAYNGNTNEDTITPKTPTVTFGEKLTAVFDATNSNLVAGCIISDLVDVTNYSKIVLNHESTSTNTSSWEWAKLFVTSEKTSKMTASAKTLIFNAQSSSSGIVELDISAVNGQSYIGIEMCSNNRVVTVNVNEMYLE